MIFLRSTLNNGLVTVNPTEYKISIHIIRTRYPKKKKNETPNPSQTPTTTTRANYDRSGGTNIKPGQYHQRSPGANGYLIPIHTRSPPPSRHDPGTNWISARRPVSESVIRISSSINQTIDLHTGALLLNQFSRTRDAAHFYIFLRWQMFVLNSHRAVIWHKGNDKSWLEPVTSVVYTYCRH